MLGWLGKLNPDVIEEFSKIMGNGLHWSEIKRKNEIDHLNNVFYEYHGVKL